MPINYKRYPPTWKTKIVPAVLKRANNCCEFCGLQNGIIVWSIFHKAIRKGKHCKRVEWFVKFPLVSGQVPKAVRVVLTVAHLDHDETNHNVSLERLAAACQLCHLRYDAIEKAKRKMRQAEFIFRDCE